MKKVILIFLLVGFQIYCNAQFITDIEGNKYDTKTYGNKTWMLENLKTTKYNDSTNIPNVRDLIAWKNLTIGAQCSYENSEENLDKYGRLYNYYAVESNKLCPWGWHVSTKQEWDLLRIYCIQKGYGIGYYSDFIDKSLAFQSGWEPNDIVGSVGNNQGLNNTSWFSGKPGGAIVFEDYNYNLIFYGKGFHTMWWMVNSPGWICSFYTIGSENSSNNGSYYFGGSNYIINFGASVRCVKDIDFLKVSADKTKICVGDSVTISAIVNGGTPPYSYSWSPEINSASNIVVKPTQNSTYTVRVTDANYMRNVATINLLVSGIPEANFTNTINVDNCVAEFLNTSKEAIQSNGTIIGNTYVWQFDSNEVKIPQTSNEVFKPIKYQYQPDNEYNVTLWVTNSFGCKDSITKKIDTKALPLLSVPSAFSPNNDGLNDVLYAVGRNIENITWIIYDRWGQKIFESNSLLNGWDGTFNGKELEAAVYMYYISAIATYDGKKIERKGDITIIK